MTSPATDLRTELARVVEEVPGVAFLAPRIRRRLRSLTGASTPDGPTPDISGITVSGPLPDGSRTIGIRLVCRADRRVLDTARAVREAVGAHLGGTCAESPDRVVITVTGAV